MTQAPLLLGTSMVLRGSRAYHVTVMGRDVIDVLDLRGTRPASRWIRVG
jgi:hypothetical protein